MAKNIKLLLTENVDNLGIVGDVVSVKIGYARNFLLPRDLATEPNAELIASLSSKRALAEKEQTELRKQRTAAIGKIDGLDVTMTRACNNTGQLYGSVTQQDIAAALSELGFPVKPREVRLPHTVKRLDTYDVSIKFESDLEGHIKLYVVADRELEGEREEEMEFDNEGELIEKKQSRKPRPEQPAEA
ncbi:MAG: large subunit ribosomal protein L9 [Phycisphaerales bacterium]|jgi:large subunit ribosomal protein L9